MEIRSRAEPNCKLCGTAGAIEHQALEDRWLGCPGQWNLRRCANEACGLAWLDPMPLEEDIGLAYTKYYTHSSASDSPGSRGGVLRRVLRYITRIIGLEKLKSRAYLLYIAEKPPGKLLEIGCGNGDRLARFRDLGWDVTGLDPDAVAAETVRKTHNIDVLVGPLESQSLPAASFDAIIMNHVFEHVHNPTELLQECLKLLKHQGVLSLATPNIDSHGHNEFAADWFPLDPPRHLYLYSPHSLALALQSAGFTDFEVFTTAINSAGTASSGSYRFRQQTRTGDSNVSALKLKLLCHVFRLVEVFRMIGNRNLGEECVAVATKTGSTTP